MKNIIKCDQCGQEFHKKPSHVKRNKNNFCSKYCLSVFNTKDRIIQKCSNCSKELHIEPRYIEKSKTGNFFCDKSCAATFNNKLKRKSRRSKIETKLYNLLVEKFPSLNILSNDKTMLDGYEVDIAIPELQLAIEWNGIVHFKPIYGQNKLDKVQYNDAQKLKIASNKDINLIVIPDLVSNDKILKQAFNEVKIIIEKLKGA